MTPRLHRRYAAASLLFAACFGVALAVHAFPVVPLFGGYVLLMVFYLSSFARGFGDQA